MRKPWVSIFYAPGTNCEEETMAAFQLAGAKTKLVLIHDLVSGKEKIADCDIAVLPGGFAEGDYIDTGIVTATVAGEFILELVEAKKFIIGICNGFQILARANVFGPNVTLTRNDCGKFVSRPILHKVVDSVCIWTAGLEGEILRFPSAHGGGKVVWRGEKPNVALIYASRSPNGGRIAGITSPDGLILGLMDHPERPWDNLDGQKLLRNGVRC